MRLLTGSGRQDSAEFNGTAGRHFRVSQLLPRLELRYTWPPSTKLPLGMGIHGRAFVIDDVLLKFLTKGLINVGGDDEKLGHLRQTAVDLAEVLEKTPAKAMPFALVAFDPDVPPTDPTIVEVEEALRKHWQTYVNTFSDTPIMVFRAMLLYALIGACSRNEIVAVALGRVNTK